MKRIPVAVTVLFLLTALCIGTIKWQQTQTAALVGRMDDLLARFDAERPLDSAEQADALVRDFRVRTALFPLFLRHSGLSEIETDLESLSALLARGEPRDVPAVLVRCREKLQTLYELELPTPENIF